MSFVIFLLFEFFKSNFVAIKRYFGLTKELLKKQNTYEIAIINKFAQANTYE